ncbi:MAG: hypothetical protein ABSB91_06065 [Sedimentisphaerales bacterium]
MKQGKAKLVQSIFEVRYEQGYRYLDRCGDVMVILEQALPSITENKIWMTAEMQPTGARIKCPELDITVVFDTYRLCIDQNPVDKESLLEKISDYIWSTLVSKFEIKKAMRFGRRKVYILPADSVEEGEKLSVKKTPLQSWLTNVSSDLKPHKCDVSITLENEDRTKGAKFSISPVFKLGAPIEIDKRLTIAPHLLKKGQHEALIEQLKRMKQREEDPVSGLMIDVDYWWLKQEQMNIPEFYGESEKKIVDFLNNFVGT